MYRAIQTQLDSTLKYMYTIYTLGTIHFNMQRTESQKLYMQ